MARVGRLAGALLAETEGTYYLVGNTKVPCDWAAAGFAPIEVDAMARPFVRLTPTGVITLATPLLELGVEGEAFARLLAATFVIERTGSVSERLWRLVIGETDDLEVAPDAVISARWLGEMPPAIWQVVRDTVLRCT